MGDALSGKGRERAFSFGRSPPPEKSSQREASLQAGVEGAEAGRCAMHKRGCGRPWRGGAAGGLKQEESI